MYQIDADNLDSLKVIKSTANILKLRIYRKEKMSDVTILLNYDQNEKPSYGLIKVEKNNKCGYLDLHLKVVIPLEYNYLQGFDGNGICIAHKNGKVGTINTKNQIVTPFK